MGKTLYQCEDLEQRFGGKVALRLPALSIAAGRIHVLVGPNGSGKSTLLALLAFLSRPAAGRIWFDGELVTWRHSVLFRLRRQVTLVHQSPYLFAGTVASNLEIGLSHRGHSASEIRERITWALERVELSGMEGRNARELSGGEAQRVALARALLLEPRVLLLDEPLANLDRRSATLIEELIAELPGQGRTVVMASHAPKQSWPSNSEIIRLRGGQLDDADQEMTAI